MQKKKLYKILVPFFCLISSLDCLCANSVQDQKTEQNELERNRTDSEVQNKDLENERIRKAQEEQEWEEEALDRKREDDDNIFQRIDFRGETYVGKH